MTYDNKVGKQEQDQRTYENDAEARRVTSVDSDGENIGSDNPVYINPTFGIPNSFTKQTSNSRTFLIQKNQINNLRLRPTILNEHVETARQIQSTLTSTNIVGQIFKASQDNINGISLTLQSGDTIDFDDFESYADSAALQAEWVSSDPTEPAELETAIVYEGDKSMFLPGDADVGTEWARTFTSTDFNGYTGTFYMWNDRQYSDVKLRVFVEDTAGNTNSAPIVNQDDDTWEFFEFLVNDLTPDGGTPVDFTDIIKIGFRLEDRRNNSRIYIDKLVSFQPPGSIDLELWDMGTTLPESGTTSIDDGTQYEELGDRGINGGTVAATIRLDLLSGKRQYFIRKFIAGVAEEIPGNTKLTLDNYYMIVLKYVDSNINVFGSNTTYTTNYYQNGYAWTAPDVSTPITSLGQYNDLQFCVFSTQDVYINTLLKVYDAVPGNDTRELVNIEDKNMDIIGVIANDTQPEQTLLAEFKDRTFWFPKGGKFEVNLNPDNSDDTTQVSVLIGYIFEPPVVNG